MLLVKCAILDVARIGITAWPRKHSMDADASIKDKVFTYCTEANLRQVRSAQLSRMQQLDTPCGPRQLKKV